MIQPKQYSDDQTEPGLCGDLWQADELDKIGWGAVLLWGGLVALVDAIWNTSALAWWNGWAVFFVGTGVLVLLGTVIRVLVPELRGKAGASLVFGVVLLAIGLGDSAGAWLWPVALIGLGVALLAMRTHRA